MKLFSVRFLATLAVGLLPSPAPADTDAVNVSESAGVSFVFGGVGFTFVPIAKLAVTRVGYLDAPEGPSNPIITIWSSTNSVLASYPLPAGTGSGQMVYAPVSITLNAGSSYSITLQNGPLAASNAVTVRASAPQGPPTNGQFQVSADLAGFSPLRVFGSNQFVLDSTNIFLLGPNFSYSGPPRLTISRTPTNTVLISWPYPSPGYALQQNGALFSTNWSSVTNQVMVVGSTNEVIIAPPVGTRFYRLKQ